MEQVFVIPRAVFDASGPFQGLRFDLAEPLQAFFTPENNKFLPRNDAETDPTHKQIIPYAVITHGDRILHYTRGGGGGEKRLHAKGSIGFGGHLNPADSEHLDARAYESLVLRELHEELRFEGKFTNRIVALLNDDTTEVGRVHLGIVHHVQLDSENVGSGEDSIADLRWLTRAELDSVAEKLEGWSAICHAHLDRILP